MQSSGHYLSLVAFENRHSSAVSSLSYNTIGANNKLDSVGGFIIAYLEIAVDATLVKALIFLGITLDTKTKLSTN